MSTVSRSPRTPPSTSTPPTRRGMPRVDTSAPTCGRKPTKTAPANSVRHVPDPQQVLRRYLLWHEAEGHSCKTEKNYDGVLGRFFSCLKSEHQIDDLADIQVEHVRAWLVHLRNTPSEHGQMRSSKTIENYARHLLSFLHWCVAEGVLDHDPTERVRVPKAEKEHIRVFTDEEVKRMYSPADDVEIEPQRAKRRGFRQG